MNNVTQNPPEQDFGSTRGCFRKFGRAALFASTMAFAGLMQGCASTAAMAPSVTLNEARVVVAPAADSLAARAPAPSSARQAVDAGQHAQAAAAIAPASAFEASASHLASIERSQGEAAAPTAADRPVHAFVTASISPSIAPRPFAPQPSPSWAVGGEARAPNIFGSVALAVGQTPSSASWRRVAAASLPGEAGPWAGVERQARALSAQDQLRVVNAWVNHTIVFTDDARLYRTADYWATAAESLRRGQGDCEDYAIAKMQLLRALGVPSDHLYLVIARDLVRHADHALLAVRADGRFWILDSATDTVLSADQVRDYRPIITYSENHAWMHGYRTAPTVMVADAGAAPTAIGAAAP